MGMWRASGEHTHQSNLTRSRGEDLLDSSCPGRRRQTKPKQPGLRTGGKQVRQRSSTGKKGFLFRSVYFLTGTKPILTSCHNIFWSAARSFFWGKNADISTGWSHSFEVEVGRTLASLFYQAVHVGGGGGNYVPVYLPSARHSFLPCSSTQGCLFHRMQYIRNLLVHVCHRFRLFLTHLILSPTNTSACL